MKKSKVLAVVLAVLMVVTLLPSMVFAAAAPAGTLEGKLKVKGTLAVGSTLSADYSKVKPEGITDDNVDFSWSLKDGDLLTEVGTDKTYKIEEKDQGLPIVLKITGKEGSGISGELTVTTLEVSATEEEAKALEAAKKETKADGETSEETNGEDGSDIDPVQTDSAEASADTENSADTEDSANAEASADTEDSADTENSADAEDSADVEEPVPADTENSGDTEDSSGAEDVENPESSQDSANAGSGNTASAETDGNDENAQGSEDGETYKLTADPTELTFESLAEGETTETATVTIQNAGTETVTLVQPQSEFFDILPAGDVENADSVSLAPTEDQMFTIQPKAGIEGKEEPYELTFSAAEDDSAAVTVKVYVKSKAEPQKTVSVEITPESRTLEFESREQGYDAAPEPQTITVTNTGTETIRLNQPAATTDDYVVGDVDQAEIASGKTAKFTVQPKTGLQAGEHNDTIQITDEDGEIQEEVGAVFEVTEPAPEPKTEISVSPDSLEFGTVREGYGEAPKAQLITVTNTGNTTVTLQKPEETGEEKNFVIGDLSKTELAAGESATFTVQPATGLSKGEYLKDIRVTFAEDTEAEHYVSVHFSVTQKKTDTVKNNLTGIKKPSDIKDLPNGTEKTQKALKLPDTVKITTTRGEADAAVKWDVKGCSYDPSSSDRQTFNVKGKVSLPDGVSNPDKISTVVAVSVTVNEYKGKDASASENKITGIDPEGKYDTNTKITFVAVGAGMDNTSPKKGDTRYQPKSWKITSEIRTFEDGVYTATFRVSKPGSYTLKVTFGQQKYDGSKWKDTGSQSESSVTFNVSQAEVLTATPTPNPSVTQTDRKSAVQTGDTTPILTFVIILIVAAGCIGGVLVYRRKKK